MGGRSKVVGVAMSFFLVVPACGGDDDDTGTYNAGGGATDGGVASDASGGDSDSGSDATACVPVLESCIVLGIDEDCDGEIDEGCVCVPFSESSCYDGPPGTEGIGACKAGTKTCSIDGKAFGPCTGQVVPEFDDCFSATDDDCDGAATACTGDPTWSSHLDAEETAHHLASATGVDVDGQGNVIAAGAFVATLQPTGAASTVGSAGQDTDVFIVKYSAAGTHLWTKTLGIPGAPTYSGWLRGVKVAVDSNDNIVIVSDYTGQLALGNQTYTDTLRDLFVLLLDPSGNVLWSRVFTGSASESVRAVEIDANGDIVILGSFGSSSGNPNGGGDIVFEPGASLEVTSATHGFLLKLTGATGDYVWSRLMGNPDDPSNVVPGHLAIGIDGKIFATADLWGTVEMFNAEIPAGGYLLEYLPNGDPWLIAGVGSLGGGTPIAAHPDGGIVAAAAFTGTEDFGTGSMTATDSDVAILHIANNSQVSFAKQLGGPGSSSARGIGVDLAGNVSLVGQFTGTLGENEKTVTSAAGAHFVAKLDSSSNLGWIQSFDSTGSQLSLDFALGPQGGASVVGHFNGTFPFGTASYEAVPTHDGFLLNFAP